MCCEGMVLVLPPPFVKTKAGQAEILSHSLRDALRQEAHRGHRGKNAENLIKTF